MKQKTILNILSPFKKLFRLGIAVRAICFFLAAILFIHNTILLHASETNFWKERSHQLKETSQAQSNSRRSGNLSNQFAQLPLIQETQPWRTSSTNHPITKIMPEASRPSIAAILSSLPYNVGTIRKISAPSSHAEAKSDKIVLHIQDVHLNSEAQANIAEALKKLIDHKKIGLLALEGTDETVDFSTLKSFPYQQAVKEAADFHFKQKDIDGPLYGALLSNQSVPMIRGIDDKVHHQANIDAYKTAEPLAANAKEFLATTEADLLTRKQEAFNSGLKQFDEKVSQFHHEKIPLGDHVKFLAQTTHLLSDNTQTFIKASDLENTIHFDRVEKERALLLEKLSSSLSKNDLNTLLEAGLSYRSGEMGHADFYSLLQSISAQHNVAIARYPELASYIKYVLLSEKIDADKLSLDINKMEKAGYASLSENNLQKELVAEGYALDLSQKLVEFSLTKEEWKEYKSIRHSTSLSAFEKFYEEAEIRDAAMAKNLLSIMEKKNVSVAVLVTGGFHNEGIDIALKNAGITSITFVPKLTQIESTDGTSYLGVFAQQTAPLDELFSGQKLFLAQSPIRRFSMVKITTAVAALFMGAQESFGEIISSLQPQVVNTYTAVKSLNEVVVTAQAQNNTPFTFKYIFDSAGHILGLQPQTDWVAHPTLFSGILAEINMAKIAVTFIVTLGALSIPFVVYIWRRLRTQQRLPKSPEALPIIPASRPATSTAMGPVIQKEKFAFANGFSVSTTQERMPSGELAIRRFITSKAALMAQLVRKESSFEDIRQEVLEILTSDAFVLEMEHAIDSLNSSGFTDFEFQWTISGDELQIILLGTESTTPLSVKAITTTESNGWKVTSQTTASTQQFFLAKHIPARLDYTKIHDGVTLEEILAKLDDTKRKEVVAEFITNFEVRGKQIIDQSADFVLACLHIEDKYLFDAAMTLLMKSNAKERLTQELIAVYKKGKPVSKTSAEFYLNHFPPNQAAIDFSREENFSEPFPIANFISRTFSDKNISLVSFEIEKISTGKITIKVGLAEMRFFRTVMWKKGWMKPPPSTYAAQMVVRFSADSDTLNMPVLSIAKGETVEELKHVNPIDDFKRRAIFPQIIKHFSEAFIPNHSFAVDDRSFEEFVGTDQYDVFQETVDRGTKKIRPFQTNGVASKELSVHLFGATGKASDNQQSTVLKFRAPGKANFIKKLFIAPIEEGAHSLAAQIVRVKINWIDSVFFGADAEILPAEMQAKRPWIVIAFVLSAGMIAFLGMAVISAAAMYIIASHHHFQITFDVLQQIGWGVVIILPITFLLGSYGTALHWQSFLNDLEHKEFTHDAGQLYYSWVTNGRFYNPKEKATNSLHKAPQVATTSHMAPFTKFRKLLRKKVSLSIPLKTPTYEMSLPTDVVEKPSKPNTSTEWAELFSLLQRKFSGNKNVTAQQLREWGLTQAEVRARLKNIKAEIESNFKNFTISAYGKKFFVRTKNEPGFKKDLLRYMTLARAWSLSSHQDREMRIYLLWVLDRLDTPKSDNNDLSFNKFKTLSRRNRDYGHLMELALSAESLPSFHIPNANSNATASNKPAVPTNTQTNDQSITENADENVLVPGGKGSGDDSLIPGLPTVFPGANPNSDAAKPLSLTNGSNRIENSLPAIPNTAGQVSNQSAGVFPNGSQSTDVGNTNSLPMSGRQNGSLTPTEKGNSAGINGSNIYGQKFSEGSQGKSILGELVLRVLGRFANVGWVNALLRRFEFIDVLSPETQRMALLQTADSKHAGTELNDQRFANGNDGNGMGVENKFGKDNSPHITQNVVNSESSFANKPLVYSILLIALIVSSISFQHAENFGWQAALGFYLAYQVLLLGFVVTYELTHPVIAADDTNNLSFFDRVTLLFIDLQPTSILAYAENNNYVAERLLQFSLSPKQQAVEVILSAEELLSSGRSIDLEAQSVSRPSLWQWITGRSTSMKTATNSTATLVKTEPALESANQNQGTSSKNISASLLPSLAVILFITTQSLSSVKDTLENISSINAAEQSTSSKYLHLVQLTRALQHMHSFMNNESTGFNLQSSLDFVKAPTAEELANIHTSIANVSLVIKESLLADFESISVEHDNNLNAEKRRLNFQHKIEMALALLEKMSPTSNDQKTKKNGKAESATRTDQQNAQKRPRNLNQKQIVILNLQTTAAIQAQHQQDPKQSLKALHTERGSLLATNLVDLHGVTESLLVGNAVLNTFNPQIKTVSNTSKSNLNFAADLALSAQQILSNQFGHIKNEIALAKIGLTQQNRPLIISLSAFALFYATLIGFTIPIYFNTHNLLNHITLFAATIGLLLVITDLSFKKMTALLRLKNSIPSSATTGSSALEMNIEPQIDSLANMTLISGKELKQVLSKQGASLSAFIPAIINLHVNDRYIDGVNKLSIEQTDTLAHRVQENFRATDLTSLKNLTLDMARAFFFILLGKKSTLTQAKKQIGNHDILAFDVASAESHLSYLASGSKIYVLLTQEIDATNLALHNLQMKYPNKIEPLSGFSNPVIQLLKEVRNGISQSLNPTSLIEVLNWLEVNQKVKRSNLFIVVPQGTSIQFANMSSATRNFFEGVIWMVGDVTVDTTLLNKVEILAQALIQV